MENIQPRIFQNTILGPILYSVYMSNLCEDFSYTVKLLAYDISTFSIIHRMNACANAMHKHLK